MFTTVLSYVALRMLGLSPRHDRVFRMRQWIQGNGTALGAASWGKWMLALLNLYDYEGLHPVLPELWLLPYAAPFHPGRFWCHARQVYLPMSYLYATRARTSEDDLIRALRAEIYGRPFASIRFQDHRDTTAPCDRLYPASGLLRLANRAVGHYERLHAPASGRPPSGRCWNTRCTRTGSRISSDWAPSMRSSTPSSTTSGSRGGPPSGRAGRGCPGTCGRGTTG